MKYFLLLLLGIFGFSATAQELGWKEHKKLADEQIASGQFAKAADNYEMAWIDKPGKTEFLNKAAEAFRLDRNYRKSAELYRNLLNDKNFPLAGFYYGKALKQLGEYQSARKAFENFIEGYTGSDEKKLASIVKQEIRGCGLAQSWSKSTTEQSTLEHLSGINTEAHEFAPLPFSDDILYFSSNDNGKARILRTTSTDGRFGKAVEPNLPRTAGGHFCHGAFTPDNERFYFTLCEGNADWNGIDTKCKLMVTMRENNRWSTPQDMRDYVMMDGTTVTHPFVYHEGDTEVLYFVSDRSGGKGGLDIWYMTRQIAGKDIDFTYPVNAGSKINTVGNETTPFYNQQEGKLFFSSNGHINIGGLDIFMAEGNYKNWNSVKNLELPYNSSADDYFFAQTPSGTGAFFVSNRNPGNIQESSTNDDLYFLGKKSSSNQAAMVSGKVLSKNSNSPLGDVEVSIYEVVDAATKRLLKSEVFKDGNYQFPILPEKEFIVEVNKDGYAEASHKFDTYSFDGTNPQQDILMEVSQTIIASQPMNNKPQVTSTIKMASNIDGNKPVESTTTSTTTSISTSTASTSTTSTATTPSTPSNTPSVILSTAIVNTPTSKKDYLSYSKSNVPSTRVSSSSYTNSRYKKDGVTTSAPRHTGEYFKVQLAVVIDYDLEAGSFLKMQDMGRLDTEYIIEKGWTRVLVADYFSLEEARKMMDKARLRGYPEAFIVRYLDGYRKN